MIEFQARRRGPGACMTRSLAIIGLSSRPWPSSINPSRVRGTQAIDFVAVRVDMTANTGRQTSGAQESGAAYPRKYWWLVLVLVPLVAALIQYQPWKRSPSGSAAAPGVSGNQFFGPAVIGNVSLVVNEARQAGAVLDESVLKSLQSAIELSQAGNHDAASAEIEAIRASSSAVRQLPSILNNLGAEYLLAGRADQAKATFEEVLREDPTNKTAWAGLGQLPDQPIPGVRVVNFSSEYSGSPNFKAGNIADGNPNSVWSSFDGTLPQSFILELPVHTAISEMSFNNSARDKPNQAAKDVEISFSDQSATSGFERAFKAALTAGEIAQGVTVKPPKNARWVKLRILSNHGDMEGTQLGDVGVVGKPQPR